MTKRDYILIAAVLFEQRNAMTPEAFTKLVTEFGAMFKRDNSAFDNARFLKACGWTSA